MNDGDIFSDELRFGPYLAPSWFSSYVLYAVGHDLRYLYRLSLVCREWRDFFFSHWGWSGWHKSTRPITYSFSIDLSRPTLRTCTEGILSCLVQRLVGS